MLEEAIGLIRELWTGETVTHHGAFYEIDTARIYTLPDEPPPIYMSGSGPKATETAMRIADGYQTTKPDQELVDLFRRGNPGGTQAGLKVCHAPTEGEGVEIAHRLWGHAGLPGEVSQVLPSPQQFEELAGIVDPEETREKGGLRQRRGQADRGAAAVHGGGLRRGVRRQHGAALRRHDQPVRGRGPADRSGDERRLILVLPAVPIAAA